MTAARRLLAVLSGVVLSFAFAPVASWGASIVAVALVTLVLRWSPSARSAYLDALLIGLGFFVPLLVWVRQPGVDAWLALAAYQAAIFALIGPMSSRVFSVSRAWPVLAAMCWVGEEWIRDRFLFGGFPWGRLAFAQADAPTLHWASWGGAPLLTFITALAGCLLAAALVSLGRALTPAPGDVLRTLRPLAGGAGLLAACGLVLASGHAIPLQDDTGDPLRVAVVQGNVPRLGLDAFAQQAAVLKNHVTATIAEAKYINAARLQKPDLYIWPENSSDIDPFVEPAAAELITSAARAASVPILVGAVLDGKVDEDGNLLTVRNSGVVWNPDGTTGALYVKRHPVPFGEYVPFRDVLGKVIGRLALIPHDFEHGKSPGVMLIGPTVLGDVICFEVAYDGIVRDVVNGGGKVLVVQTNNATFGRGSESTQQLQMSRIRAVEHNRAVVVSATSGISAVISPRGEIEQQTAIFTRKVLVADLPQISSRTVADHVRDLPEHALTALLALCLLGLEVRRRKGAAA